MVCFVTRDLMALASISHDCQVANALNTCLSHPYVECLSVDYCCNVILHALFANGMIVCLFFSVECLRAFLRDV